MKNIDLFALGIGLVAAAYVIAAAIVASGGC